MKAMRMPFGFFQSETMNCLGRDILLKSISDHYVFEYSLVGRAAQKKFAFLRHKSDFLHDLPYCEIWGYIFFETQT